MAHLRGPLLRQTSTASAPLLPATSFASTSRLSLSHPAPAPASRRYVGQNFRMPAEYLAHADPIETSKSYKELVREKDVLLTGLPTSATPADIKALAREPKTHNDIGRIEYIYTRSMLPSGKAIVSFSSSAHARLFEMAAHGRILGGRRLNANLRSTDQRKALMLKTYGTWPVEYKLAFDLIEYEWGKLVLLRNIPQETYEARLEERLAPRYDLRPQDRWRGKVRSYANYSYEPKGFGGSHDAVLGGVMGLPKLHPDATTRSFIVRCQTQTEAMRLVRRWHNTYFAPATFDIQDTGGRYRVAASILY